MAVRMTVKLGLRLKLFGSEPSRWALSFKEFDVRRAFDLVTIATRHLLRARAFSARARLGRQG
ncbi:hypothetical protein AKJ09_01669 [Labilithrix luteola]|uniref:Uncharacterized protein n=1 Tax=Labilithrix luteola TaxID=1391654 RepID=A0A0K1PN89_9BACT|nr:hypothetical protein AKJ09_01669 [Labilithrix luteola]